MKKILTLFLRFFLIFFKFYLFIYFLYVYRKILVTPRRNPSRKARVDSDPGRRMATRSMTTTREEDLVDGIDEDDQEFKRKVYRTV